MQQEKVKFDYFYKSNAEQYTFYKVPKLLFTSAYFKKMSCEAKILYGLMLDRMGLSLKNHWVDEYDRVYISYSIDDISDMLGCASQKAVRIIAELENNGLITKKRLGLGRSNIFYVHDFMVQDDPAKTIKADEAEEKQEEKSRAVPCDSQNDDFHNSGMMNITNQENQQPQFQNDDFHNSGMMNITNQENQQPQFQNDDFHNSGMMNSTKPEFPKSQPNKTDINKTKTDKSIHLSNHYKAAQAESDGKDGWRAEVYAAISYEELVHDRPQLQSQVDNLAELIIEVLEMPPEYTIMVNSQKKLAATVQARYRKLNRFHIEYIVDCLDKTSRNQKISNIKAYLLTALYNAPVTIKTYYAAAVNYDMCNV